MNKVVTSAFYGTFKSQYRLNGLSNLSDSSTIFAQCFKIFSKLSSNCIIRPLTLILPNYRCKINDDNQH